MLTDLQARRGAAAAQGILRGMGSKLAADGIWSTLSQEAFDRLSGVDASRVNAVVAAATGANASVADLVTHRKAQKATGAAMHTASLSFPMDTDNIKKLITAISLEEGVPPKAALQFCRVESNFSPLAASKKANGAVLAAGLFQLTDGAIKQIGVPPPNGNKFDIEWNIRVGVRYMKWVARFLNTTFDNVGYIYAGYNLGVGNVLKLQQGKFDDPVVDKALKQQAAALKKGGAKQYLANATAFVASHTV